MQKVTPTPRTFTLRCKCHRTTILIEVDPLQKLAEVRAELLSALLDTNPSGKLNGTDVPQNPEDILLGRAVDRNNLALGFVSLDKDVDDLGAGGKGKGKSAQGSASKALAGQLKDCPQGAGLKNGDVVVFKFRTDDDEPTGDEVPERWDVTIPTLEDTYGNEEEQDEGIGLEE